jgi:hypothetical protein
MTRYVIHRETCASLCGYVNCTNEDHRDHACSCNPPSPQELAELVEAAQMWVALDQDSVPLEQIFAVEERLDAALKPFTKENQ